RTAPPPGGALAPPAVRPAAVDPVAARTAGCRAAGGPPRRRRGVRDVFAAPGRDRGEPHRGGPAVPGNGGTGGRAAAAAGRTRSRRRADRAVVAAPARYRRDVPGPAPPGWLAPASVGR